LDPSVFNELKRLVAGNYPAYADGHITQLGAGRTGIANGLSDRPAERGIPVDGVGDDPLIEPCYCAGHLGDPIERGDRPGAEGIRLEESGGARIEMIARQSLKCDPQLPY